MKQKTRAVCLILAVMLAAACLPLESQAMLIDTREWNGFVYTGYEFEEYEAEMEGRPVDKSAIRLEIIYYEGKERELTIPTEIDGMKVTAVWSLSRAKNLRTLHIPDGVEIHKALADAPKLKKITVSKSNKRYSVKNNALLNKKGNVLMGYPGGYSTLKVPDSVTKISGEGLRFSKFKKIKEGKNLKTIGNLAFSENKGLETLVLDKKVQYIGDGAFGQCRKLKKVVLGKRVKRVGYAAFDGCEKLKSVYIYNKNCKISKPDKWQQTIPDGATIYGWKDSTAQKYAEKYHLKFVELKKK